MKEIHAHEMHDCQREKFRSIFFHHSGTSRYCTLHGARRRSKALSLLRSQKQKSLAVTQKKVQFTGHSTGFGSTTEHRSASAASSCTHMNTEEKPFAVHKNWIEKTLFGIGKRALRKQKKAIRCWLSSFEMSLHYILFYEWPAERTPG